MSDSESQQKAMSIIDEKIDWEKYKEKLDFALKEAKRVRSSVLQEIQKSRDDNTVLQDNAVIYTNINRVISDIKKDLDEADLESLKQGNYNVVTWSKAMKGRAVEMCALMSNVCGIGAGFTYATIFSATRGSIALMSWAFVFFLGGFLIPAFALFLNSWMTTIPPDTKFRYPGRLFKTLGQLLVLAVFCGALCMAAGLFLLLFSLYGIRYSPVVSGASPGYFFTNSVWIACLVGIGGSAFAALSLTLYAVTLLLNNFGDLKALKAIFFVGV